MAPLAQLVAPWEQLMLCRPRQTRTRNRTRRFRRRQGHVHGEDCYGRRRSARLARTTQRVPVPRVFPTLLSVKIAWRRRSATTQNAWDLPCRSAPRRLSITSAPENGHAPFRHSMDRFIHISNSSGQNNKHRLGVLASQECKKQIRTLPFPYRRIDWLAPRYEGECCQNQ